MGKPRHDRYLGKPIDDRLYGEAMLDVRECPWKLINKSIPAETKREESILGSPDIIKYTWKPIYERLYG